jgi:isopentenyl-diphosphate delta-isomerase type 1
MHSSTSVLLCATAVPSIENSNAGPNDKDTQTNGASSDATKNGYGIDMDQNTLMETDMLVAVDENDHLVPNTVLSKKMGHTFNAVTPRATLHRAFSFFIFNADNELLLTQRAPSKITFPNVWTNTVCSHPLYGMTPNEADVVPDAYPHFPGIKQAAIRKCLHELGIPMSCLDPQRIQFITRFHYWAADTVTYGNTESCPWGEHEVDYILFYQLPPPSASNTDVSVLPISPNPEEVSDYKYVSIDELRNTMFQDPNLLWSPWFRGIMDRGGFEWWEHLPDAMAGTYTNDHITYFDPPLVHYAPYNLPNHTKWTGVLSSTSSNTTTTKDENGHNHKL